MKNKKLGFSMVEIIITISILIIISVVAVTSMDAIKDKSNNSKIISDIETLKNGFKSYNEDMNEYPLPKGNLKFYTDDTSYSHSYDDAFGVSGFVTEETLPNKYINNLPLDPKTGQYYAYAKTKNTSNFEIAGVLFENNNPISFVSGNWKGEFGPKNLVKEYAGPNFVFSNSTENFPYNPYEKMLIAKISSYSGEVLINGKSLTKSEILSYNLGEGDKVSVGTGGTLNLYYSDGSNSVLGDTNTMSEIVFANMRFVEENNLFTSIKLALNIGSLWTKASKLSDKSDFEVYTTDAVAAVRGTIFGLKKETNNSQIVVQEGKVEVKNIVLNPNENIVDKINSGGNIGNSFTGSLGIMTIDDGKSYIEVNSGSGAKGIKIDTNSTSSPSSSTGAIDSLPEGAKNNVIYNTSELNGNDNIVIPIKYSEHGGITIKNNTTLQKTKELVFTREYMSGGELVTDSWSIMNSSGTGGWENTDVINLSLNSTGQYQINAFGTLMLGKYELSFCNENDDCTKKLVINIDENTNYNSEKQFISCNKDIDTFYESILKRKPSKSECKKLIKELTEAQKNSGNTNISKEKLKLKELTIETIKKNLHGKDCDKYKKNFGEYSLDGYDNCTLTSASTSLPVSTSASTSLPVSTSASTSLPVSTSASTSSTPSTSASTPSTGR